MTAASCVWVPFPPAIWRNTQCEQHPAPNGLFLHRHQLFCASPIRSRKMSQRWKSGVPRAQSLSRSLRHLAAANHEAPFRPRLGSRGVDRPINTRLMVRKSFHSLWKQSAPNRYRAFLGDCSVSDSSWRKIVLETIRIFLCNEILFGRKLEQLMKQINIRDKC